MIELLTTLFKEGGWITAVIFAVSLAAWIIGLQKLFFIRTIHLLTSGDPLPDDVLRAPRPLQKSAYALYVKQQLAQIESGLSTMAVCISTAPLLGLFGTITGMNKMFAVITEFGIGSPHLMAEGIGIALKATLTGLSAAVAAMFFLNYLVDKKQQAAHLLHQNGQRLLAE